MNYADVIYGTFYDGKQSERSSSALRLDSAGMIHIDGAEFEPCSYRDIRIPSRVGNVPRLIELPNDARFETDNNDAVDQLTKAIHHTHPLFVPHNWESKLRYVAASVLIVVLVIAVLTQYGIPFASEKIANRLPPEYATVLAEQSLDQLDRLYFERSELNTARQNEIRELFETHQPKSSDFQFALYFRQSPTIGANAFALPNGSIIITDELVALAQTDEEILSILFHEMGHVVHRHALRRSLESAGLYAVYSWVTGDLETLSSALLAIPAVIMGAKYSRGHEWESDTYALAQMSERGLDPVHFANVMSNLEKAQKAKTDTEHRGEDSTKNNPSAESPSASDNGHQQKEETVANNEKTKTAQILDFIASHPPTKERIERFREASKKMNIKDLN